MTGCSSLYYANKYRELQDEEKRYVAWMLEIKEQRPSYLEKQSSLLYECYLAGETVEDTIDFLDSQQPNINY